jgi:hypothetical protein
MVVHACDSSYMGGVGITALRLAWAKNMRTYLKNNLKQKVQGT